MDIYKARELQKKLYKNSPSTSRCGIAHHHLDGKLCYYISHLISVHWNFSDLSHNLIEVIRSREVYGTEYAIVSRNSLNPSTLQI